MKLDLDINQLRFLFDELKKIYPFIINKYSKRFNEEIKLSEKYYSLTLSSSIQSTTYLFFYKLYKYKKYIDFDKLLENNMSYEIVPNSIAEINENLKTVNFHKEIDKIFGFDIDYSDYPENKIPKSKIFEKKIYKNHLFNISYISKYYLKINKFISLISYIFFKNRNIYLSMANADHYFWNYSFYAISNIRLKPSWSIENFNVDKALRDRIFNYDLLDFDKFDILLKNLQFEKKYFQAIKIRLNQFYKYFIPKELLETSKIHYLKAENIFNTYKPNYIITADGGSDIYSEVLNAYAMSKNINVIKCQHGGHYGYINYMRYLINEVPNSKNYITWGWKECLDINNTKFIDLPSPWLSEKKKYWKKLNLNFAKHKIDLIFMPQNFKYFDVLPLNSSFINNDLMNSYKVNFFNLISTMNNNNISTLVKYFNVTSFNMLFDIHKKLQINSPSKYIIEKNFDKGISKSLATRAKMFIWCNPGTGFLECVASDIPTIVYWDRSYSKELPELRNLFAKLEKIGIINSSIGSTLDQIQLYLKSPENWLNDKLNRSELIEFKNSYCMTDKYWWKKWKNYLKDIDNELLH